MALRFAFAGFRHGHIKSLYFQVRDREDLELFGAAEDHAPTAESLQDSDVVLTHDSTDALFADADKFDVLAVGDYFTRRGELAIRAMELGKHVIADKPACTSLVDLDRIEELSKENGLSYGSQLTMRSSKNLRTLKRLVEEGAIGRVHTVHFGGQHPLLYGKRADWYFEEGKHGGTITDIAIHAVDALQWLLGSPVAEIIAARVWNERLPEHPSFNVCAQMMLRLEDETGVIGDVSYLSPDSQGYKVPQYWRFTLHGDGGILETSTTVDEVRLWKDGSPEVEVFESDDAVAFGYLDDFINEIQGNPDKCDLTTDQVIQSMRAVLLTQRAAEEGLTNLQV